MGIKNKKVLITAGPTWVPIDKVRVISNVASGDTGILLAEQAAKQGAKVTLILGPVGRVELRWPIRLLRFTFFDELRDLMARELKSGGYDIVIHSAAVSDYQPITQYKSKIKSDKKNWLIRLSPTIKIVDIIKKNNKSLFAVGFKFEPEADKQTLIKKSKALMKRAGLGLVVANTTRGRKYLAYIVAEGNLSHPIGNKKSLAKSLIQIIKGGKWEN